MKNLKVMTILGTRPEIIRLSSLIKKLDFYCDHILVHTGQNSDPKLNGVFFSDLSLRSPDFYLGCSSSSPGSFMGEVLTKVENLLKSERPDAVMILGDTNSAISAVVSERLGIPVYHMEAGNRSFDRNVPEELNRRMVDHVSTFNLPYNSHSHRNLVMEGLNPRFLCKTGSPLPEVISENLTGINSSSVHAVEGLEPQGYVVASLHRQENVDDPNRLEQVIGGLGLVGDELGVPVLLSTHPRTRTKLEHFGIPIASNVRLHDPFGFLDYCRLQMDARLVVSDSGTVSEESAILGFPAISPRLSIERPESLEAGGLVLSELSGPSMVRSAKLAISEFQVSRNVPDGYEHTNFSEIVVKFVFSTATTAKAWLGLRDL